MIQLKLATAALLGLTAVSALAQAPAMDASREAAGLPSVVRPGYEPGAPQSNVASNIVPGDTRSAIAPALPVPPVSDAADAREYLRAAHRALVRNRTGEAQEALERAETRLLSRVTTPDKASVPNQNPMVSRIKEALVALGNGDRAHAIQVVDSALAS